MTRIANNAPIGSMFKVPMVRDSKHLGAVRKLTCCSCGRKPSEAAHVRRGHSGMARKPGDDQTVPLCHDCHMTEHTGPVTFWDRLGLNPLGVARAIYTVSPDVGAMQAALNTILWERGRT